MIVGLGIIDLEVHNSPAIATSLLNTVIRSSFIGIKNTSTHVLGLSNADLQNNGACHHFYGVVLEYEPVYTAENLADFEGATEDMIGQLRPAYADEYFLTTGKIHSSGLKQYQTQHTCVFISSIPAGPFYANGSGSLIFPKNAKVITHEPAPTKDYPYINGHFNAPIKWANSTAITNLVKTKLANGTLVLPEGEDTIAGKDIPVAFYADTPGLYDIGYGAYAAYSNIDWTNSIIDYVNPENSKIVNVSGAQSFKPENYLTTDATAYYPSILYVTCYPSSSVAKTPSDTNNFIYAYYFNKPTDSKPTWKNA
jgi:hypothetical protein